MKGQISEIRASESLSFPLRLFKHYTGNILGWVGLSLSCIKPETTIIKTCEGSFYCINISFV